ncbi:MAG TPA: DNA mismatch repair protein MutS, partial [Rikenellaceae bacterium]|nr:DNA mismatch repair protein MutS [Rikenellaceae bacterium]
YISAMDEWAFVFDSAREKLINHFDVASLKGFGIENMPLAVTAAGAILSYLELTRHDSLGHLCSISRIDEEEYVWIDKFTFRNLEVFGSYADEGASLIKVIDKTSSPMGGRLLRNWIAMPVKSIEELNVRHNIVEVLLKDNERREELRGCLEDLGDLERIISKAAAGKISPREVVQLKKGLQQIPPIKEICSGVAGTGTNGEATDLAELILKLDNCSPLVEQLIREILPDPAGQIGKGDIICPGISE